MAGLSSLISKAKVRHQQWEAGSKEREKRKLDKVQTKRAREAIQHLYRMERAKRKVELEERLADLKEAELRRKTAQAKTKSLKGTSFWGQLLGGKKKPIARRQVVRHKKKSKTI